jgi:hypothetical protein
MRELSELRATASVSVVFIADEDDGVVRIPMRRDALLQQRDV